MICMYGTWHGTDYSVRARADVAPAPTVFSPDYIRHTSHVSHRTLPRSEYFPHTSPQLVSPGTWSNHAESIICTFQNFYIAQFSYNFSHNTMTPRCLWKKLKLSLFCVGSSHGPLFPASYSLSVSLVSLSHIGWSHEPGLNSNLVTSRVSTLPLFANRITVNYQW